MPNGKGYKNRPESYYQPSEASAGEPCPNGPIGNPDHWAKDNPLHGNTKYNTEGNYNGDGHDFNIKGKITNVGGSDYHDLGRKDSGLHGNFAEKDSQREYLLNRNKQGQILRNFGGTSEEARLHTYNTGGTAYNGRPIDEVYKPATSHSVTPPDPVVRPKLMKTESDVDTKNPTDVTKKIK